MVIRCETDHGQENGFEGQEGQIACASYFHKVKKTIPLCGGDWRIGCSMSGVRKMVQRRGLSAKHHKKGR